MHLADEPLQRQLPATRAVLSPVCSQSCQCPLCKPGCQCRSGCACSLLNLRRTLTSGFAVSNVRQNRSDELMVTRTYGNLRNSVSRWQQHTQGSAESLPRQRIRREVYSVVDNTEKCERYQQKASLCATNHSKSSSASDLVPRFDAHSNISFTEHDGDLQPEM